MFKPYRKKDKHKNYQEGVDLTEERYKWMKLIHKVSSSGLIDKASKLVSWVEHMEKAGRSGTPYVVSTGSQVIPPGKMLLFQVMSPANSSEILYIEAVTGGASREAILEVLRNASFSDSGSAVACRNREWAGLDESAVTAKYLVSDTDTTAGNAVIGTYIINGLYTIELAGTLLPANRDQTVYLKVTNISDTNNVVAINLAWSEADSRCEE